LFLKITMYRKILVALENSRADESLLPHVTELAKRLHSQLLLVHVADGWVARNFEQLKLAESQEMKDDRSYLMETAAKLRAQVWKYPPTSPSATRPRRLSEPRNANSAI